MKTIERQIRNHEFEIQFEPAYESVDGLSCMDPIYKIDGVSMRASDFAVAIQLLTSEATK